MVRTKLPLVGGKVGDGGQPLAWEATRKYHPSWLCLVYRLRRPHAGDCVYQADVLIMKCCWACIQKQHFLLFGFCRNLEGLCDEWWHSGCSGDLTTPHHGPSQREVFRQSGWEQSRILAREEHGTRPSPGLQHDGAKKEGVHDSAKSRKRSFFFDPGSSVCFHFFSLSALLCFLQSIYLNTGISALCMYVYGCWRVKFSSSHQTKQMKKLQYHKR